MLDAFLALAREPARRAGQFQQRAALREAGRALERLRRLLPAFELEQREAAPEGVIVVGQLLEAAFFQQLARVVHRCARWGLRAHLRRPVLTRCRAVSKRLIGGL